MIENDISTLDLAYLTREYYEQRTYEEIKKHTYIDPLYDVGFKAFMNDEQALVSFLNGVFHLNGDKKITSVTIKSSDIELVFPLPKPFRLDIRATAANGFSINVEMQKARPSYFVDRVLLQHSAFMLQSKYEWDQANFGNFPTDISNKERARREAHRYEIPPTYAIWICDFKVPKQKGYSGTWAIRNDRGLTITDKVKYIMYDLTQFTKPLEKVATSEDRWLYLLKHAGTSDSLPNFGDDIIAKALERIRVANASEKLLKQQAANMVMTEEELDYLAFLEVRAEAKGEARGKSKGHADAIGILKDMGFPAEQIAEVQARLDAKATK